MNLRDSRKLLLNKKEINKLIGKVNREGLTVIPTKIYFKKGKAKVEIAIAKGKKLYDKEQLRKKEIGIEKKQEYLVKINNDFFRNRLKFTIRLWR